MSLPVPRTCCSDLELDQLLLGELDDGPRQRLEQHLASSPACAARLATLRAEQQAWQQNMPPLSAPSKQEQPLATVTSLDEARRRRNRQLGAGLSTLAAAAAVFVVVQTQEPDTRTKGGDIHVALSADVDGRRVDVFSGDGVKHGATLHAQVRGGAEPLRGSLAYVLESGAARATVAVGAIVSDATLVDVELGRLPGAGPRTVDVVFLVCDRSVGPGALETERPWPSECAAEKLQVVEE